MLMLDCNKYPNFLLEERSGYNIVAGIDEAGRGSLSGPVVASCVILNRNRYPKNINDSKKLSKHQREVIFSNLKNTAKIGIGIVNEDIIDKINILNATKLAMKEAFDDLCSKYLTNPDFVLIDGNFTPNIKCKTMFVIKGDQKSLNIAAASIVAKKIRDDIMIDLDKEFPQYFWCKNKGYATKHHLEAIRNHGACCYHRKSFKPLS